MNGQYDNPRDIARDDIEFQNMQAVRASGLMQLLRLHVLHHHGRILGPGESEG